ncbi:MAG: hypothetical protein RLP15_10970 [Cryomorphaceae bacterium]
MPNFLLPFVCLLGLSCSLSSASAQVVPYPFSKHSQHPDEQLVVQIDSSSLVMDRDMHRYLKMMDSLDVKTMTSRGYRIQIFSAAGPNARKIALEKQAEFLKLYSDGIAYTKWNYPNWVVRLGDFRTHLSALEFHHEIREIYPASFIVKDEIKVD